MTGQDIIDAAKKYLGVPYSWGGTTCQGMDCSGYVQKVLSDIGVAVPRTAQQIYGWFQAQGALISYDAAQSGDLLFFHVPGEAGNVNHTGIYAGNGSMYAESSTAGRALLQSVPSGYSIIGVGHVPAVSGTSAPTVAPPSLSPANTFGGYGGTSIVQLGIALGVLAGITLLVPPKYGVWIPWLVLLGYGAVRETTVGSALGALGAKA